MLVDISRGASGLDQERSEYGAVNPARQVPVLEWQEGGETVRLSQSVAILEYLEQRFPAPALLPEGARERARVRQLVECVNAGIQPLQNSYVVERVAGFGGDAQAWLEHFIGRGLRALETMVAGTPGPFLAGASVTMADVFLVPQLFRARVHGVPIEGLDRLLTAEAACDELAAFQRARPERQDGYSARFGSAESE